MAEVRAKVKLTNALDEMLARQGKLAQEGVRVYETEAIVDTGAVCSVFPVHVVQSLGLEIRKQGVAGYADGRKEAVGVTDAVLIEWEGRSTVEEALVLGDEVLIGQTVLEKLDLLVDCNKDRLIPNPANPNQPVNMVR
ncbi:MAG: clan AA aspartic protease [Prochloron sp. SP5CPC1]|nr:clan AA aspartic protease [Candidatus Paraprochloron terpiosi SP5CPC1]